MDSTVALACCSLLFLAAVTQVSAAGSAAAATRLLKDLNKNYDKITYPDNVSVELAVSMVCAYMEEDHSRLSSRVVERYHWVDNRLSWDPTKYEGIDKISVPDVHVWTPDVKLQNAIMKESRDEVNVMILDSGDVYWVPPANYRTRCVSNDDDNQSHHCELSLGSWTYDTKMIPLETFKGGFYTKLYLESCPYVLENSKAEIVTKQCDICPNPYATLHIEFDIHKKDHKHEDSDGDGDHDDEHEEKKVYSKDCVWPHC